MRTSKGGFALPELLFALAIFSIFLVSIFGLFSRGYRAFNFLEDRQSIQGELLRLQNTLRSDFRLTHLSSVGVEVQNSTSFGQPVRRDNICCVTLDDWRDSNNFDPATSIPLWNRYYVYQCDTANVGRLERLLVDPGLPLPLRAQPLNGLGTIAGNQVVGRLLLSDNLESFECLRDTARQEVVQTVRLRKRGGRKGDGLKKADNVFEAEFRWIPINTVPRL